MPTTRFFKGPLFASHRKSKPITGYLGDVPVVHGVINEEDYLNERAGRPIRKSLELQRKNKEIKDEK